ncbi:MAG: EamA family transporter [Actinomycetia bacterium]|nr:EamA family transporter [Actinomycetes bacterium]
MSDSRSAADSFASRFPFLLIASGVLFYGTGPVLARSSDTSGSLLSFWRLWFGVAVFLAALVVHRVSGRDMGTPAGWGWAVAAGTAFSLNQVLFFTAVKRTSVADTSLMSTLSPIIVAVLAIPLFGERPAPAFRLWSLMAIFGATFVILGSSSGSEGDLVGMLMALGSATFFSGFFLISKWSRPQIPVVGFLTGVMASAAVWVSLYVVLIGESPSSVSGPDKWRALAMAVIPGALGHVAMTWPLRYVPANVPPLMRLAGPVVSGGLAWVLLGEAATWVHLAGGAVILGGQVGAILSPAGQDLVAGARDRRSGNG